MLALLALGSVGLASRAGAAAPPVRYYLALGDSLSQGQQPDAQGVTRNTSEGYADQLAGLLRRRIPGLRLVKLGCGGETTGSMISGRGNSAASFNHCHPAGGSQLRAAVRFLRAHHRRGEVALVTIDIGANDVDGCAAVPASRLGSCITAGEARIRHDLPIILHALDRAAGPGVARAGMTLYDPVLSGYFSADSSARSLATASVSVIKQVNAILASADTRAGFRTADVAGAFKTYDTAASVVFDGGRVPVDVARVCSWTWACSPPPSGPNIHANKNGYAVIAGAFARVLGGVR